MIHFFKSFLVRGLLLYSIDIGSETCCWWLLLWRWGVMVSWTGFCSVRGDSDWIYTGIFFEAAWKLCKIGSTAFSKGEFQDRENLKNFFHCLLSIDIEDKQVCFLTKLQQILWFDLWSWCSELDVFKFSGQHKCKDGNINLVSVILLFIILSSKRQVKLGLSFRV